MNAIPKSILVCILLCGMAVPALAQVAIGTTVKPIAPLPLQQAPPQGYFGFKGQQIGTVMPGTAYVVVDTRTVPTLSGKDTWLQVQNATNKAQTGWIYTGSDAKPYQNIGH